MENVIQPLERYLWNTLRLIDTSGYDDPLFDELGDTMDNDWDILTPDQHKLINALIHQMLPPEKRGKIL